MTRTYAAVQLLKHGPLCFADFLEITGWKKQKAADVLSRLHQSNAVVIFNHANTRHYALI